VTVKEFSAQVFHNSPFLFVKSLTIMVSAGGNVVLFYASKYKDIHIVVNISGRFNLVRGIEGRLGKRFMQKIKQDGYIDVKNKRGEEHNVNNLRVLFAIICLFPFSCVSQFYSCFFIFLLSPTLLSLQ